MSQKYAAMIKHFLCMHDSDYTVVTDEDEQRRMVNLLKIFMRVSTKTDWGKDEF